MSQHADSPMQAGGLSLRELARALGGQVVHGAVLCPGPLHSRRDRSLSVRLSQTAPDGFTVHSFADDDFRACRDHVRALLGLPPDEWRMRAPTPRFRPTPTDTDDASRTARAEAIWEESRNPQGTLVERYLKGRGLALDAVTAGAAIRFHPACPWRDQVTGEMLRVPAMIALFRHIETNQVVAIHRTRLSADGMKVGRMMLGPARGAAVKLDPDEAVMVSLAIGEGVETTLAGRMLGFRPAWAMGSAGAIAKLPVLPGIETLSVLTERDEAGANERATAECGDRWHAAGREVLLIEPRAGKDANDAIRELVP